MNWTGWQEFVAMGGYAPYVWGAIFMVIVVIIAEISQVVLRRRDCQRRLSMLDIVEFDHEDQNQT